MGSGQHSASTTERQTESLTILDNVVRLRDGYIDQQRIVAIVSSKPAFLMTETGRRYDVGSSAELGYQISRIDQSVVEFKRGDEVHQMNF